MSESLIIQRALRVPRSAGAPGDGAAVARQLDSALLSAGFALSGPLLAHLSGVEDAGAVADRVLAAVRELVGAHVRHNTYFLDFPANVPDTLEFWAECLRDAGHPGGEVVNLLDLPLYGSYQHTYEELLAAHEELIASAKDRVTVLHLGGPLAEEERALYLALAGSPIPLAEHDLVALGALALSCVDGEQPEEIPIRENRAVVNRVRVEAGAAPLVDTVTDVLRLACALSEGDVTLETPTRFRSFRRPVRGALMRALDAVAASKLGDVRKDREAWKRLGERLHPHEYPKLPHARDVFAVARGDKEARSLAGRVEVAFRDGDPGRALDLLRTAPGMLVRNLDRLLRSDLPADRTITAFTEVLGQVSGRVLLSLREHLENRRTPDVARVFTNRRGRGWVTADERTPLADDVVARLCALLDDELLRRLPAVDRLVVDPDVLPLAIPLSAKATSRGFGVVPRGSRVPVDGAVLRFFTYWREEAKTTDFDLSVQMLDDDFEDAGQLSWTSLTAVGGVHSGDITSSADGASEFIELDLAKVTARYLVPQVNVYSGEGFHQVAESFFGFQTLEADQRGMPFEARAVRVKSDLRGTGRVALPVVFARADDGTWSAFWLHLHLTGHPVFNRVEANQSVATLLVRATADRRYLTLGHLVDLLRRKAGEATTGPVTYIGVERPDGLPEDSDVYALDRLSELVPL